MKKLLVVILLSAFSVPALAVEVKLTCDTGSGRNAITHSFDEANQTVDGIPTGTECDKNGKERCDETRISADYVEKFRHYNGKFVELFRIDRRNGRYWNNTYSFSNGNKEYQGNCTIFKQMF